MDLQENSTGKKPMSRRSEVLVASTIILGILAVLVVVLATAFKRDRLRLREMRAAYPEVQQVVTSEDQRADFYILTLFNRDGTKCTTKHDGFIGTDELKLKQLANDVFAKHPEARNFSIEQKVTKWCTVVVRNNDGTLSVIRIDRN